MAGTAGLLLLPGIGSVFIAGPLINDITAGAIGAGLMTAGVVATHLTIALHRLCIPGDKLEILHQAVMDSKTLVLIYCGRGDPLVWHQRLTNHYGGLK